jgi:molecular chaperone Hsp33
MFQDYLFYGTDVQTRYAFRMCNLSTTVEDVRRRHGMNPYRGILLGDVLLGGVLLSSLLEEEERINLRVQLASEFTIASETTRHAELKGYLEGEPNSPIMEAIDSGSRFQGDLFVRSVRAQKGRDGKMFEGITKTFSNNIEHAIQSHLAQSFQLKAGIRLGTWLDETSGMLRSFGAVFLELPNLDPKVSEKLWDHVSSLPDMKELWSRNDDPDALARTLIPDEVRAIRSVTPKWTCTCSQESVEKMLRSLAPQELSDMIESSDDTVVKCHYCGTAYTVTKETLRALHSSSLS